MRSILSPVPHATNTPLPCRDTPIVQQANREHRRRGTRVHLRPHAKRLAATSHRGTRTRTRRALSTRLLHIATVSLRALAAKAPQVPLSYATPRAGTRICSDVSRADGSARAFWKRVGLLEEQIAAVPHQESWIVGCPASRAPSRALPKAWGDVFLLFFAL